MKWYSKQEIREKILKAKLGDEEINRIKSSDYPVTGKNSLEKAVRDAQLSAILKEFEEK